MDVGSRCSALFAIVMNICAVVAAACCFFWCKVTAVQVFWVQVGAIAKVQHRFDDGIRLRLLGVVAITAGLIPVP